MWDRRRRCCVADPSLNGASFSPGSCARVQSPYAVDRGRTPMRSARKAIALTVIGIDPVDGTVGLDFRSGGDADRIEASRTHRSSAAADPAFQFRRRLRRVRCPARPAHRERRCAVSAEGEHDRRAHPGACRASVPIVPPPRERACLQCVRRSRIDVIPQRHRGASGLSGLHAICYVARARSSMHTTAATSWRNPRNIRLTIAALVASHSVAAAVAVAVATATAAAAARRMPRRPSASTQLEFQVSMPNNCERPE